LAAWIKVRANESVEGIIKELSPTFAEFRFFPIGWAFCMAGAVV